ncbi:MAG TPA: hypothetical protein VFN44_07450, partial [Solirubrobacteraceae bacterium]|nr:hypothetical protein [Solirubrobacteraceae bacterium]
IRELLAEALAAPNGDGAGRDAAPAVYPPPPVAAVHRPSTWTAPAAEPVPLRSDADLDRFVLALLARFEDPAQREAIRAGRVRFTLAAAGAAAPAPAPGDAIRVARGAVTERKVVEAAKAGARLVLGPGAVLTPLAREKARSLGIELERER